MLFRPTVAVLFALTTLAASASAATFLDRFTSPLGVAGATPALVPGCGCADVSGEWNGLCTVNGVAQTAPTKLSIQQKSCQGIIIDGEMLPVGGQQTQTLTTAPALCDSRSLPNGKATTGHTETTVDWDRDKATLVMHQDNRQRVLSGISETTTVDGTLKRVDAKLQLDITSKHGDGTSQVVSCTFEK